ncbi:TPA: V-type ATPase subunit [Candidatus Gracilibacteria bacterium]|nr:hypothetical protein [Candidatus Peregrinibacteria bacterium]HIQ56496.1 V-type ATPase subunit [Candidatus Gracilibacteria bacterium]HIQ57290.1 V-type ATPase subunit [Candidatus Gracilibacteria bacterium]
MSQLIHAVARIRAMESELLTQNSANRMISASSFESAYAVLDELGYAKESSVFRDVYNYEGAIEAGLFQTSQIFKAFDIKSVQRILTIIFDIQNIILYIKALDKKSETNVETLVDSSEVISYGYYSKEILDNAFINNSVPSDYVELLHLIKELDKYDSLFEKENIVEVKLFELARKEAGKNYFLLSFLSKIKESQGLKRDILIDSEEILEKKYSEYKKLITSVFKYTSKQEQISILEILLDEEMVSFLKRESAGKIDGYEVLFSFFWRKERNARVIRSILLAKKSGFSPESIKAEFNAFIF